MREIHIPDSVEEICDKCFYGCRNLSRVTFGESSSLKRIGHWAFHRSGLTDFSLPGNVMSVGGASFSECPMTSFVICDANQLFDVVDHFLMSTDFRVCYGCIGELNEVVIPDSVEELSCNCFYEAKGLSRIKFGERSSLKVIGKQAFCLSGVSEIHIPDGVEELCEFSFYGCQNLSHVTFGNSSSLKCIGDGVFHGSGLADFSLPGSVVSVGGSSFSECPLASFVISDMNKMFDVVDCLLISKDMRVCYGCIGQVKEVIIPGSVEELCDKCFYGCRGLSAVTFGESSSLRRVGKQAFHGSGLSEIHIPDSVEELCDFCFFASSRLSHVAFGESSSLKCIGKGAFHESCLRCIHIPDNVEELCDKCFYMCKSLSRVTFGESSSLKRIGREAFFGCCLRQIHIPEGVEEVMADSFPQCTCDRKTS